MTSTCHHHPRSGRSASPQPLEGQELRPSSRSQLEALRKPRESVRAMRFWRSLAGLPPSCRSPGPCSFSWAPGNPCASSFAATEDSWWLTSYRRHWCPRANATNRLPPASPSVAPEFVLDFGVGSVLSGQVETARSVAPYGHAMNARMLFGHMAAATLFLFASCARTETYGLVAVLGNDTTSVERITRTGSRIVGDAIGRSPTVTRRHWEAELAPNGVITSWSMDTYIPNASPADQRIHHTAAFSDRATSFTRRTSAGSRAWAYQRTYPETVPWNAFVYGTWELLLDAARRQPDTTRARIGQYFFEGWDEGHVGYADIVRNPDGSYAISSTGLAGSGLAHVDTNGRLTSYSGQGTTYKQEVRRTTDVPDIDAITTRFAAEEQRTGLARSLSPRDTVRATVGEPR